MFSHNILTSKESGKWKSVESHLRKLPLAIFTDILTITALSLAYRTSMHTYLSILSPLEQVSGNAFG